jgi:NADPH2:quinone reductase
MSNMMQAVRCHRFAGTDEHAKPLAQPHRLAEVLSLDQVPKPTCGADEVLIQVNYAGIQYPDALQAQGLYQSRPTLPYIPGMDVAGTVVEIGGNVTHVGLHDQVIGQLQIGGLAEYVAVPSSNVWKAPEGVELAACANIGRNYFAAYHSLKVIGELKPDDVVLIDGASGGVGMAAIDLAKAMQVKVIAGVSTTEKAESPRRAGADVVLVYGHSRQSYQEFKNQVKAASTKLGRPQGVDCVLDMVQGDLFEAALVSAVRPLGRICLIGFTAGQKPIRPGLLLIKQAAVVGSLWGFWAAEHPEAHQQHVREILGFMETGAFQPHVDRLVPFDNFIEAFEIFENNQGRGNTVVCVRAPA